jgi:predicted outer membrane repeat protein
MAWKHWAALGVAGLFGLLAAGRAHAVAFEIKDCTTETEFRRAVEQIASDPDGGTLSFACGDEPVAIVLDGRPLEVLTRAIIDGGGRVTLSGGGTTRIFTVGTEGELTLRNLRLVDGYSPARDGGAIASVGSLTIHNAQFENNRTGPTARGGAIASAGAQGSLTITGSRFAGNEAGTGGAVSVRFHATEIADSAFLENVALATSSGGGGAVLVADGASIAIDRSTFARNQAIEGGAIFADEDSSLSVVASRFVENQARAGGGALLVQGVAGASRTLFALNEAAQGGALFSTGFFTITNSTLDANKAGFGGALYVDDKPGHPVVRANIVSSTLTRNHGVVAGSVVAVAGGRVSIANSILGESVGSPSCSVLDDERGTLLSAGANLVDDDSCALRAASDRVVANLALGPLSEGTGPTAVRRPFTGSPAVDTGVCDAALPTDQRGVARPQGSACDIGAVESRQFALAVSIQGNGSVRTQAALACSATCVRTLLEGTQVTLEPQPAPGFTFAGWAGACAGTGHCTLTLDANMAVTAVFEPEQPPPPPTYRLSVIRVGGGSVWSDPAGIACGAICQHAFPAGTSVRLTADPAGESTFASWSAPCSTTPVCEIVMMQPLTITATFSHPVPTVVPDLSVYLPGIQR